MCRYELFQGGLPKRHFLYGSNTCAHKIIQTLWWASKQTNKEHVFSFHRPRTCSSEVSNFYHFLFSLCTIPLNSKYHQDDLILIILFDNGWFWTDSSRGLLPGVGTNVLDVHSKCLQLFLDLMTVSFIKCLSHAFPEWVLGS